MFFAVVNYVVNSSKFRVFSGVCIYFVDDVADALRRGYSDLSCLFCHFLFFLFLAGEG